MNLGTITTLTAYKLSCNLYCNWNYMLSLYSYKKHLNACKLYQATVVQVTTSIGMQKIYHKITTFKNITGATSRSNPMVRETSKEPTSSSIGGERKLL